MMIVLLPVSAYAQGQKGPLTARTDAELKNDAAIDKDYQDTMKRTSKKAVKSDPWQSVRPAAGDSATANTTTNTKR